MHQTKFREFISSIPLELWKKNLSIGNVENIEIENVLTRKYSYIAKCALTGSNANCRVYIKLYRNIKNLPSEEVSQQVNTDYQTLVYYYNEFKDSDHFGVAKPLFILPEYHILVTLEVLGITIYDMISSRGKFFVSEEYVLQMRNYFKNIGRWLKYFQSLDNSQSEYYSIDTLVEYMNIRLKILTADSRRHFNALYSEKILEYIKKNRELVKTQELYIKSSHNDFNLSNIIIQNDGRVTILDFSKIYKDSFLLDVSRIYHQLYLITFKPQYKESVINELQKALLKGFGIEHADRLMLFRFFLIRHTLTHLVGITRFWKVNFKERLYNRWVLHKELNYLEYLMQCTTSLP